MSASCIGFSQEDQMWAANVLGEDEPVKLCDTVMFLIGLTCALHGDQEHQDLRCPGHDCQLTVEKDIVCGEKVLVYKSDDRSKTNQGGLKGRKCQPKVVHVPTNPNFNRDLVHLFEKYCSLLPKNSKCSALYRYPLAVRSLTPSTWYTDIPLGVNALKKIVSNLTEKAGLVGKFSNHSLCASAATRMYEQGIDEQTIKHITGHKSDAVQSYKHVNRDMLKHAGLSIVNPGEASKVAVKCDHDKEPKLTVLRAHKNPCVQHDEHGQCPPSCALLKKIDEKCADSKVKKMKLSLKYRRK